MGLTNALLLLMLGGVLGTMLWLVLPQRLFEILAFRVVNPVAKARLPAALYHGGELIDGLKIRLVRYVVTL